MDAKKRNAQFPTRMRGLRELKSKTLGRRVSQSAAGEAIGVTRSSIGLYEIGENVPDIKKITKIAEFYDTTVNYLLGIDERPTYEETFIGEATGLSAKATAALLDAVNHEGEIEFLNYLLEHRN